MILNIGCGDKLLPDAINMDIRQIPDTVMGDIRNIPFGDCYFDEIYATDVIEHLTAPEADKAFKELYRVAKDDSAIFFQLPSLEGIIEEYKRGASAEKVSWWLFGGQDYKENYHYAVYDVPSFKRALNRAGLELAGVEYCGTNMKIVAIKIKEE